MDISMDIILFKYTEVRYLREKSFYEKIMNHIGMINLSNFISGRMFKLEYNV